MSLGRNQLIGAIAEFLANQDSGALAMMQAAVAQEIDRAPAGALEALGHRLAVTGNDWSFYESDPLARRLHQVLADRILKPGSTLVGGEHVAALAGKPTMIIANHLSYADANLLEVLLHRNGNTEFSQRLTVIAGPKVYSSLKRRFSSLCFGTIKTPQSSARSSEDAVMNPREVARAARRSIEIAHERLASGDALLVFGEGTRSRNAAMQEMLPGVSRYFDPPGTMILPVGITGTEALFPVGSEALHAVHAVATAGAPIAADALRARAGEDRRLMMDALGIAVARLLPSSYQGVYGPDVDGLDAARDLLDAVTATTA